MGGIKKAIGRVLSRPQVSWVVCESLRPISPIVTGAVKSRLPTHRVRVRLPGTDRSVRMESAGDPIAADLFWNGFGGYEHETLALFMQLLRVPPRTFFDVGAFTGLYGLMAGTLSPATQVHAFEPTPATFRRLAANAAMNRLPNLHLHRKALSDRSEQLTMYSVPDAVMGITNSMVKGLNGALEPMTVAATSLDEFVETNGVVGVDLMKVDVESAEHLVFRGATGVLDRDRPIVICEILAEWVDPSLEELLAPRGYRYFLITGSGLQSQRHIEGDPSWQDLNYLLVPEEKLAALPEGVRHNTASAAGNY